MRLLNTRFATIVIALSAIGLMASCHAGKNNPGRAYASDMYYSRAVEIYYPSELTENGMSAILPAENTVAYGHDFGEEADASMLPFPYAKTPEGYQAAGRELHNPIKATDAVLAEGKHNFLIYCAICHGDEGDGKGTIVTNGKYTGAPPSYLEAPYLDMSEGTMFYSVQYGKGAMGSYAYAMDKDQRWKVIAYVKHLQNEYKISQGMEVSDSSQEAGQEQENAEQESEQVEEMHEQPAAAH